MVLHFVTGEAIRALQGLMLMRGVISAHHLGFYTDLCNAIAAVARRFVLSMYIPMA